MGHIILSAVDYAGVSFKALVPVGVEPRVEPLQKNPPENPSVLAVHGVLDRVFFWTKLALKLPW